MEQLAAYAVLLAGAALLVPLAVMIQSHSYDEENINNINNKTIEKIARGPSTLTSHTLCLPPDQGPGAGAVFR